jgi:UDP-GlcNAc3NAcA epimerase
MRVFTVIGARPQFIKAAPVSRAFASAGITEVLVHTGQHYDFEMSEVFFRELEIPEPRHSLGLGGGSHGAMTGRMLEGIEKILLEDRPDWLLVYGDTNSTLAGALAATKLHIPVCHVEAGLRSWNRLMPEEINRVLTDHISTRLFCSSETGVENLKREGVTEGVEVVGDVMADASALAQRVIAGRSAEFLKAADASLLEGGYGLLTLHRAENTDDRERFGALLEQLNRLEMKVVFPIHPRTKGALAREGFELGENILTIEPVGYLEMAVLLGGARLVLTDSGGLQKEAYWSRTPCVTLRTETEWTETVEAGWNAVIGDEIESLPRLIAQVSGAGDWQPLYGDGQAARRIVDSLTE